MTLHVSPERQCANRGCRVAVAEDAHPDPIQFQAQLAMSEDEQAELENKTINEEYKTWYACIYPKLPEELTSLQGKRIHLTCTTQWSRTRSTGPL